MAVLWMDLNSNLAWTTWATSCWRGCCWTFWRIVGNVVSSPAWSTCPRLPTALARLGSTTSVSGMFTRAPQRSQTSDGLRWYGVHWSQYCSISICPTTSSTLALQWLYQCDSNIPAASLRQLLMTVQSHSCRTDTLHQRSRERKDRFPLYSTFKLYNAACIWAWRDCRFQIQIISNHAFCLCFHCVCSQNYSAHAAYCNSKLAQVLFSSYLHQELQGGGFSVSSCAVDPGMVDTALYRYLWTPLWLPQSIVAHLLFRVRLHWTIFPVFFFTILFSLA